MDVLNLRKWLYESVVTPTQPNQPQNSSADARSSAAAGQR